MSCSEEASRCDPSLCAPPPPDAERRRPGGSKICSVAGVRVPGALSALWLTGPRLEAGVDGFALECEHAEDAFVHSG